MLLPGMRETFATDALVKDIRPPVFSALLTYIYTDTLQLEKPEDIMELLVVANQVGTGLSLGLSLCPRCFLLDCCATILSEITVLRRKMVIWTKFGVFTLGNTCFSGPSWVPIAMVPGNCGLIHQLETC